MAGGLVTNASQIKTRCVREVASRVAGMIVGDVQMAMIGGLHDGSMRVKLVGQVYISGEVQIQAARGGV
jgi:mannose/fructose/N-acetylgalactosamine-specific phosphotransferase system component IIC